MLRNHPILRASLAVAACATLALAQSAEFDKARPKDDKFFPVAVWLQSPHNAQRYKDIGVNLYVGLYQGPTEQQLKALAKAKMPVICHQNVVGLKDESGTIVAWMHGDEPDNAQRQKSGGYGPPTPPHEIVKGFEAMRKKDKRAVLLNLGQGAAWDGWHGRGNRTNHPEDYPEYVKGCDIVSFDIYPVTHTHKDVKGKLEFVGRGVQRLRKWSKNQKPVWACIETGHVDNKNVRPTPDQVENEVWQAIACGADGIIYFAHEFAPKFVEAGLLKHEDVRKRVANVNKRIASLAHVLNSKQQPKVVTVTNQPEIPVAIRVHRHRGSNYAFVASLSDQPHTVHLDVRGQRTGVAKNLGTGENRRFKGGKITVDLGPYGTAQVHITR